jgi:hypothetical protein
MMGEENKIQNWNIPAGTLLCFTEGAYSDYGICGNFVVLQDIKPDDALEALEQAHKDNTSEFVGPDQEAFIAKMIRGGFLASVNVHEIHLGSYALDIGISKKADSVDFIALLDESNEQHEADFLAFKSVVGSQTASMLKNELKKAGGKLEL